MGNEVIILSRSLPFHHLGGMEVVAWDLAVELQKKGFATKVITTDFSNLPENVAFPLPQIIKIKNIPVAQYSKGWWYETEKILSTWQHKENVCAVISISAGAFGVLKIKHLFPGAKYIMQAHGTSVGEFYSKIKTKKIKKILSAVKNVIGFCSDAQHYKYFDAIVAVGEAVENDLLSFPTSLICNRDRVVKIENGIDQNLFTDKVERRNSIRKELGINAETLLFLSASRLHEQKGVDANIDFFAKFKKEVNDSKYIICGDGPYEKQLRKSVKDHALEDDVLFLGAKTREELAVIMQGADIFLFLTKRIEGLPLNVLEAMSAGLPSILSEHLSFEHKEKIFKCNPDNINIGEVICFINKTKSIGRKSFIPVKNTLSNSVQQYISLFQRSSK